MQGRLPLMDADRARRRCAKCNALYDSRAYHAAFCPSTRAYIHDGIVRELRDCIRAAGACVLCEPVNVLPHAPEVDSGAELKGSFTGLTSRSRTWIILAPVTL